MKFFARHIILLRRLLTISLLLLFIAAERNFGMMSNIDPEILTLEEERGLHEVFIADKKNTVDSIMFASQRMYAFHGSYLLAENGVLISSGAVGYADFREKTRLTNESAFQLASVSKQFTAIAIVMLEERGKLSFDDKVCKYITGFPYERITVRQLLNHTSGLPNYMWLLEHKWDNDSIIPNNRQMMELLAKHNLPLYFTPGRKFDYSNTGYAVLASLVEKISGMTFREFMRKNVFDPLQMNHTFVYSASSDQLPENAVSGYYRSWRRYRPIQPSIHDGIVGDKGIYSNVSDLYKWDQALYSDKLVSREKLTEVFTKGKVRNRYDIPYGFGFRLRIDQDGKKAYHYGRWEGFRTAFIRYIDHHNTIILLNHTNSRVITTLANRLKSIINSCQDYHHIEEIVDILFSEGIDKAEERYLELLASDINIKDELSVLSSVVDYLESISKPVKAREVKQLYFSLSSINNLDIAKAG